MRTPLLLASFIFFGAIGAVQAAPIGYGDYGKYGGEGDKTFDFGPGKNDFSYHWSDEDHKGKGDSNPGSWTYGYGHNPGGQCDPGGNPSGDPSATPLPGSMLLFGTALLGLTIAGRKRLKKI